MKRTVEEDNQVRTDLKNKRKKQASIKDKSLIIVHTGDGKGKTTAALGMVMRTIAHGQRAAIVQFMKSNTVKYGEVKLAVESNNLDVFTMGAGFTWDTKNREIDIRTAQEGWSKSVEIMNSNKYRLVVLDEINYVIDYEFLDEQIVLRYLENKPKNLYIVLTGRNAKPSIIEKADLVTEMKKIKHPFDTKGLLAQKGIEW